MNKKNKRGFTLIELIVVVGIITLLTTLILSSLGTAKQKSNDTSKIRSLQEVRSALQIYFSDYGYYPGGTDLITPLTTGAKNYISSIDPNIVYQGTTANNAGVCAGNCASYVLAIQLSRTDNVVLATDKNINVGSFDGSKDNCTSGAASVPDLCYDVTP